MYVMASARKETREKRGKTCNWWQSRENIEQVRNAGKCAGKFQEHGMIGFCLVAR